MDLLALVIRSGVYLGVLLTVGSIALRLTLPLSGQMTFSRVLSSQAVIGATIIVAASLITIIQFLLTIAGGDIAMAFSVEFLGIAAQTPIGQAEFVRVGAVLLLMITLLPGLRSLALVSAVALVLSFGLEGHSLSHGPRVLTSGLVVLHVTLASWWLAVLLPLIGARPHERDRLGRIFGVQAVFAVPVLLLAGAVLFGLLTGWRLDLSQVYQQRLLLKLAAVTALFAAAAANKLFFTGRPGFLLVLRIEAMAALAVLGLTAWLTASGPDM